MSRKFEERLLPRLSMIVNHFVTPFHIYDEEGIVENGEKLKQLFSGRFDFQEFFAVKALPNIAILRIMYKLGFGFDCSSIPELFLVRRVRAKPEDIIFTSNNTRRCEFVEALRHGGCILNLDDIILVDKFPFNFPGGLVCFRYNPGERRSGTSIIGNPVEAKYGLRHNQVVEAYRKAIDKGAKRFGLHTMIISNELDYNYMVETVHMLLGVVEEVSEALGIRFEFINIGGGIGIPYRPDDEPFNLEALALETERCFSEFKTKHGYVPKLYMESGRAMTCPHGVLVTRVINRMSKYREYVGLDACMSSLMRPAIYNAYHHITVFDSQARPKETPREVVDVVGSLCENNDKFAIQRELPKVEENDILIVHETGAHGHAMGFTYNGRLRPKELLLRRDGSIELIRRAETNEDYFRTMFNFAPDVIPALSRREP